MARERQLVQRLAVAEQQRRHGRVKLADDLSPGVRHDEVLRELGGDERHQTQDSHQRERLAILLHPFLPVFQGDRLLPLRDELVRLGLDIGGRIGRGGLWTSGRVDRDFGHDEIIE